MTLRLFIGIELTAPARERLVRALDQACGDRALPSGLRRIEAQAWHITLQFLGSVRDELVDELRRACAPVAAAHSRFELDLVGAGAFPSAKRARVLWAGIERGHSQLAQLARALEQATAPLGFAPEARAYRAHVTLARGKPDADVRALLDAFALPCEPMPVHELVLFRSHLSREGARYEAVDRFALAFSAQETS